jgi:hypothetical protein
VNRKKKRKKEGRKKWKKMEPVGDPISLKNPSPKSETI